MWKKITARQATWQHNTMQKRFACRVTKAKIMFNITGFPQLQPLHDRAVVLRYTYIVCLVLKCPRWDWHRVTCCHRCAALCFSRAVVTTATVVILQMQTADRARSELAGVQDVGWDKGDTVRAEDYNFFYAKRKRKSSIAKRIYCTPHSTISS